MKFNIIFIYITDDYTIAKQKAKASEDTSNISSSNETSEERLTRFQKIKKKVMKNDFKKIEKLKWNTNSLDSPGNLYLYFVFYIPFNFNLINCLASSIDEEDDDSDKDPNYSNTVIHEENYVLGIIICLLYFPLFLYFCVCFIYFLITDNYYYYKFQNCSRYIKYSIKIVSTNYSNNSLFLFYRNTTFQAKINS